MATKADTETMRQEALVVHEHKVGCWSGDRENMINHARAGLEERNFSWVGSALSAYGRVCLRLGMSWYKLHADEAKALVCFEAAEETLEYVAEVAGRIGTPEEILARPRYQAAPGDPTRKRHCGRTFGACPLLEPIVCLALANRQASAFSAAEVLRAPAMLIDDERDAFSVFTQHLAVCIRGDSDRRLSMSDYDIDREPRLIVNGYREPLVALASGDTSAIAAALPEWHAAFRARARLKYLDDVYGATPRGQLVAFDALATTLVRIANWRGAAISAVTESVPAAFCQ